MAFFTENDDDEDISNMISETQQMFSSPRSPYTQRRQRNEQHVTPAQETSPRYTTSPKQEKFPEIRGDSPHMTGINQILPYEKKTDKKAPYLMYSNMLRDTYDGQRELSEKLDMRLNVAEKSNRALLEEVIRLQNDLKATTMNSETLLQGERMARQQLESRVKTSNEIIEQLNDRIAKTELKVQEERSTLASLVNHTKQVEQAVIGSQQQIITRKDAQGTRIEELRDELGRTRQFKDNLERSTAMLTEDFRLLKSKFDDQMSQIKSMHAEFSQRTQKLEDDNKLTATTMRRQGEVQTQSDQTASHLRGQIDTRLSELRGIIMDLRTKGDEEVDSRRNLEQQVQTKMNELATSVSEQNRKREEAIHAMDASLRKKEHDLQQRCMQLQQRIVESADDVNSKTLNRDMKLREDMQEKYQNIDKLLREEQTSRFDFEKEIRDSNEKRWSAVKKLEEEEIAAIRETLKNDRNKSRETLQKLDQAISLIEKELRENKRQVEKVMAAEIKSRKARESENQHLIGNVQEKLQVATSTLQQAIGGVSSQLTDHQHKLQHDVRKMIDDSEQSRTRALADLDAQIVAVKRKVSVLEATLEERLSTESVLMTQNLREKISTFDQWKEVINQSVHDLNTEVQKIPKQIQENGDRIELLKSETENRIKTESEIRLQEIQSLQKQLTLISNKEAPDELSPLKQDISNCQLGVKKLAESIQTVKTVLGMKLQSEQKLRVEEVNDLHLQLVRLRALVEPLVNLPPEPRIFIKDRKIRDKQAAEKNAININKWSIYNAYRWYRWLLVWRGSQAFQNPRTLMSHSLSPVVAAKDSEDERESLVGTDGRVTTAGGSGGRVSERSHTNQSDSDSGSGESESDANTRSKENDDSTDDDDADDTNSEGADKGDSESEFDEAYILNDGSNASSDSNDDL